MWGRLLLLLTPLLILILLSRDIGNGIVGKPMMWPFFDWPLYHTTNKTAIRQRNKNTQVGIGPSSVAVGGLTRRDPLQLPVVRSYFHLFTTKTTTKTNKTAIRQQNKNMQVGIGPSSVAVGGSNQARPPSNCLWSDPIPTCQQQKQTLTWKQQHTDRYII